MATFTQRKGAWQARVRIRGQSLSATFDSHDEARAWAAREEGKLLAGAKVKNGQAAFVTVVDLLDRYAEEVSTTKRGERWEVIRLGLFRRFSHFAKALRDFGPEDVAQWRDERLAAISPGSVNRELNLLSAVFTHAIKEWRIGLRENPVHLVKRPRNPPARKRRTSDAEVAAIAAQLGWDGKSVPATASQWVALAHALAVETAMRRGELLSMRRSQVLLDKAMVRLRSGETKNSDARDVPLSRRARALLALALSVPGEDDAPAIPVQPGTLDALFRRARDAAGIEGLHFHDSRREATTRIAPKVGDPLTLAKITGHRDHRMLQVYFEPDATELADKLD